MSVLPPITDAMRVVWPRTHHPSQRDRDTITRVREDAEQLRPLSAGGILERSDELRELVHGGADLCSEGVLVPGLALVCEAARRTIGIDFYDVQLLAGLALTRQCIAEMQTGEGKTFVAALPACLFALAGRGVHVMTVNAYLAERDCELLEPLYRLLGMSVDILKSRESKADKQAAYACDIVYGPGYEFGFDYLKDQAAILARGRPRLGNCYRKRLRGEEPLPNTNVQRGHAFAIIDEIDSVLIDEATSPLILSEGSKKLAANAGVYIEAKRTAGRLVEGEDFLIDTTSNVVRLTEQGAENAIEHLEQVAVRGLQRPWPTCVEQALRASILLKNDVDYVIDEDKVLLVDESTGRIFAGRSLREGLHQAIEAKEKVSITAEQQPIARISRQRYFRLYDAICGMTGTATGNEREFWEFYRLPVVRIPLRKSSNRKGLPPRFFPDQEAKWQAIADDVKRVWGTGQPVLVGTRTIENSLTLAQRLDAVDVPYRILNGIQDTEEADVVSQAGQRGAVTIATNMAGRGTDIKLSPGVDSVGGMHVIVSEPHESTRVDRQLVGRSGRQGDPGSYQDYVAADDPLISRYAPGLADRIRRLTNRGGLNSVDLSSAVRKIQRKAEKAGYTKRRKLFAHDDWLKEVLAQLAKEG